MKIMDRKDFLKSCARGGLLTAIAGSCAVLVSRENKFECSRFCGKCVKFDGGKCALGIK